MNVMGGVVLGGKISYGLRRFLKEAILTGKFVLKGSSELPQLHGAVEEGVWFRNGVCAESAA